ncbi:pyroglutamyl-peptidase I [bacterium]|nr:pyroglutamyl-peptidase I [bacterium]
MPILVTAFEPFSTYTENSSQWILEELRTLNGGSEDVQTLLLPVSYERAADVVLDELAKGSYDQILMLGMAGPTSEVRIETLARNRDEAELPDCDGIVRRGCEILPDGPETLLPSFPRDDLKTIISNHGFTVEVSESAGRYVCNHTYFLVAAALTAGGGPFEAPLCTFIHVPAPAGTRGFGGWSRLDARRFSQALAEWFRKESADQ